MATVLGLSNVTYLTRFPFSVHIPWMRTVTFLFALAIGSRVVKLVKGIKAIDSLSGFRIPFAPFSIPSATLPDSWWNPGFIFIWKWRKNRNVYRHFDCDSVSFVPFIYGSPMIFTQSLAVARRILQASGSLDTFDKSPSFESPFSFWGPNIIDSFGHQWRKHRKISGPAFNNETYATVWDTSCELFTEMMNALDSSSKDVIEIASINSVTLKFSLTVFTSVGFGAPVTWSEPLCQDGELSVLECLDVITKTTMLPVLFPTWAWKLPFSWIQHTRRAYDTMRIFVRSQVNKIRETVRSEASDSEWDMKPKKDLLSLLIRASEDVGGKPGLTDDELIGDVFSFLYAGHDTTAHGLAATLAFLALHSDIQDEIASQVLEITEGSLRYEDYSKLDKVLAAFYEAIRMIPPGPIIPREAKKDVILNISDTDEPELLFIKKGTHLVIDLVGLHYNPRCYSNPETYRPSRWYAENRGQSPDEKDGGDFTGFGFGPRSCIGRKYSTTEAVCFLAHLLRDWRVEPSFLVHPGGRVESMEEWQRRVLQADITMTLGIKDHSLRFVRRN